jgi:hypothetical protein
MAQRPFVAGAAVVGIVAAALHLSTATTPSAAPQSSIASSSASARGKHAVTSESSVFDQLLWTDEMKNHPETLGKLSAKKELDEAIDDFYTPPCKKVADSSQPTRPNPSNCDQDNNLEVMIAIEPDPVHTHLALWFDRDIDALEDALQESGWQYQANWLPWSSSESSTTTSDHFVDQQQQSLFLEGREQYPGILLFRPNPSTSWDNSAATHTCVANDVATNAGAASGYTAPGKAESGCRPLAIFVVGNSPTAGINRVQFYEALSRIKTLAPQQTELRILGPSFTGSGPSLRALLPDVSTYVSGIKQIQIVSGSVSDSHCDHLLPKGVPKGDRCTSPDLPNASFVSFGIDKEWRTQQIETFLHQQGRFRDQDIAELSEDESGYGSYVAPCTPPKAGESSTLQSSTNCPTVQRLRLHFPRNISHLRSAYQKSNIFGFGATAQGSANISLNLDFDETNEDDDAIPSYATQQMPVSQDGVMHQITDVLEQRRIKVVLLSATDVLDELFVAEILAHQAPNVLVIILQADDLFLRSGSGNNFSNMYFVSAWPLIPDNQLWSTTLGYEGHVLRIYPSDNAEGLHAAVRYLFRELGSHPPTADSFSLADYSSPFYQTARPPLWLSAVGHGAYWPVAFLDKTDTQSLPRSAFNLPPLPEKQTPAGVTAIEHEPLSHRLVLLLVCFMALYHAAKCVGVSALHNFSSRYDIADLSARTPKLLVQLFMTVLFVLLLALSASPFNPTVLARLLVGSSGLALCIAAFFILFLLARPAYNPPWPWSLLAQSLRPLSSTLANFIAMVVMVSVIMGVGYALFPLASQLWQPFWKELSCPACAPGVLFNGLFRYRASYPLRGISPIFPLFLTIASFLVFFYSHLERISFTSNVAPHLPKPVVDLPNCPTNESVKPLNDLLAWPPDIATIANKLLLLAIVAVLFSVVMKTLHLRPRMFDGFPLQRSLGLSMFLLVIAVLWELTMAIVLWRKLKSTCLDPLESSPLRRGFSTISGLSWSSFWIIKQNPYASYRAIIRLLEQASRSALEAEASRSQHGQGLRRATEDLWDSLKSPTHLQQVFEAFGRVQERIAGVAGLLLIKLKHAWQKEEDRITAPDANGAEDKHALTITPPKRAVEPLQQLREEWVALVYVHYIRMVLLQIRSRLITAASLYLFLVWAGTSYPYLNRHVMLIALSALLGVLSVSVISTYASINRDAILSRTTNHVPGQLDLDFYLKTASLVGIPLLGFIASQFPEISSFLFSWIEPGMTAVK